MALLFVDSGGTFTDAKWIIQGALSPALCAFIVLLFSLIFINDLLP